MGLARGLHEGIRTDPSGGFERTLGYDNKPIPLTFRVEDPKRLPERPLAYSAHWKALPSIQTGLGLTTGA
ncbi:hypothetical protein PHISCL_10912 [Aspergillus sclerotialis]|uniref:Uncharacterized protein n=1 Tax=Aspergillus sclerotialis TaxID=2070753 RepID=A0A3A2ZHN2_9EURO|nr:hypothetical protein PHISCL_10912 [Aspergillus sclerotialis]